MTKQSGFSKKEEALHAATHGLGAILGLVGLVFLVVLASKNGDVWRIVSFSIYGTTLFLLYLASTLYHSITHPKAKHVFRVLDHCSIYFLIAGTYTPFALVTLRGPWGWSFFGVVWALALLGVVFKIFFIHRFNTLSTLIYVAMGWLILIGGKTVLAQIPPAALKWLLAGGIFYTIGAVAFLLNRIRYHHVVWHLFVMAGSICHFGAILFHVLPG